MSPRTFAASMGLIVLLGIARPGTAAGEEQVPRENAFSATTFVTAPETAEIKRFTIAVEEVLLKIEDGISYYAWTFGGTVPGPTLRVREGDHVEVTLENHGTVSHGIDLHAAAVMPGKAFAPVAPGGRHTLRFVARQPGVFMYHCSALPIITHIANGMYGVIIVDPKEGRPRAKEFVLVQGEFYGEPDGSGVVRGDSTTMMEGSPTFVVFNGGIERYLTEPLMVKPDELVRLYMVNAGPNTVSALHVIGTLFDRVSPDGNPRNALVGVQTQFVPPGGGAVFEFHLHEPGDYPVVTHVMSHVYKGAIGVFRAEEPGSDGSHGHPAPSAMRH
ncbi:MAG TPA: multicopper oxidase domain-containing protein [Candidatus Methylomirabilis sp.]|nr:multicopper oxidase domain-containing protein [Candidatus Methylomirabilis sp.]